MNKFEYRNSKSETNPNFLNSNVENALDFVFWIFKFVSNLVLRISDFGLQGGQALVTLLFFVLISLTITTGAIIIIIINSNATGKFEAGILAYNAAESGAENALLRLLRDPSYTGETLTIDTTATAVVTVSGSNPKTVVSVGQNGKFKRTVQAQINYNSGYYTFSNWKEI